MSNRAKGAIRLLISILLGSIVLLVYRSKYIYIGAGDTIPAEQLPIALIEKKAIDFSEFAINLSSLPYWYVNVNGRVVDFYPIIPGMLNWPAYYVAHLAGMDLRQNTHYLSGWTSSVVTACSVSFMYLALSLLLTRQRDAILFTLVYAFGTAAFSVTARGLWQHGPSIFFLSGAIALLLYDKRWSIALAGFALGMAVWNRPTNFCFALPLGIYIIAHRRQWTGWFVLGASIPAVLLAWYSMSFWGSLLALGQGHCMVGTHGPHHTGLNGPFLPGFTGILFSPARGLFIYTPAFLLAVPMVFRCLYPRLKGVANAGLALLPYLAIGTIFDIVLYSKWTIWWGGHSFGYRMLIEIVPVMILFLALAWDHWLRVRWWTILLAWLLIIPSIYVHYLGYRYYNSHWNVTPINVDDQPGRLWDWNDWELIELHRLATSQSISTILPLG